MLPSTRSPSNALSHPFFGGGFPYKNRQIDNRQQGTLILALEDLSLIVGLEPGGLVVKG